MERPKIQMLVNDGEEEELVELAAPSADAAIRLKLGVTFQKLPFKLHHGDAFWTAPIRDRRERSRVLSIQNPREPQELIGNR